MPDAAFQAMKAAAQASAVSLRDGFADTAGRPRNTVVIPSTGIVPSIGEFVLAYSGLEQVSSRMLSQLEVRELSDFDGTLNVEFNVAVDPADSAALTADLTTLKDSAAQLTSLTSAINSELASNGLADAVVTGAVVAEIKDPVKPTSRAPTPAPTPVPATPAPTSSDDDEGGSMMPVIIVGGLLFVAVAAGGVYYVQVYLPEQEKLAAQGEGGVTPVVPQQAREEPFPQPAATSPAGAAAAPASAAAPAPGSSSPINPATEPRVELSPDAMTTDDQTISAAVQIDES